MKSSQDWYFRLCVLLAVFVSLITSQQSCPPPDVPLKGEYFPKIKKFQPGDKVVYNCTEGFTLMGRETSKCKSNGDWSNRTPFCDLKANLRNPYSLEAKGYDKANPNIIDGDLRTCSTLRQGESLGVTLPKRGVVYAMRIFLEKGVTNIEILTGSVVCATFNKYVETRQWIMILCNKNDAMTEAVKIQDKSPRGKNTSLCEIEVYVKEEDGCESPPDRRISNGYFEVTRSTARLICDDGYKSENTRLVCERNSWIGTRLQCEETLCDPILNITISPGSEWIFVDSVKKISAGTRRKLRCSSGYIKHGGSDDIITCRKDGTWTRATATCIEEVKSKTNTKAIIIGVVGIVVVVIILALLGTTIYFVRKQRREVVVVYKQPAEGSMVSGSEGEYGSGYYETIQSAPGLPSTTHPTAQMLSDGGYFLPQDSKDTLKKQPLPSDIAFGVHYDLPYQPISS